MKNIFPDQLIQRPARQALPSLSIRSGDRVTLRPADGGPPVKAVVKLAIPLFGCTTYTSDVVPHKPRGAVTQTPTVFRFRSQDIHHVEHA